MINICFVCTGNTCRSIMAERICKKMIGKADSKNFKITSRGINALGDNIAENAKIVLKEMGCCATNRKSIKLGKTNSNTLYITMTDKQKNFIKAQNVISISSLIGHDVLDPYGKDLDCYRETAKEIRQAVEILLKKISNWRY